MFAYFWCFSSREELKLTALSSIPTSSKHVIACAFCCCNARSPWFKGEIKSYGPLSKLSGSPSSNELFRPYLETDTSSTSSRSPESKETTAVLSPTNNLTSMPIKVGHLFRTSVQSVVDAEEMLWCHTACMECSTCTSKKFPDNPLMVLANALTQVCISIELEY